MWHKQIGIKVLKEPSLEAMILFLNLKKANEFQQDSLKT